MKNKNLYIGLGVLAVAGVGFYMWKKKKDSGDDSTSKAKLADASTSTETPATTEQTKSNARGVYKAQPVYVAPNPATTDGYITDCKAVNGVIKFPCVYGWNVVFDMNELNAL